jgi:hypothetical protein
MILVNRWLKVIGVFGLLIATLTFLEVQSVDGQTGRVLQLPVKPGMHNIQLPLDPLSGATRPYMPAPAQIQSLQNGGSQFGFNGITGTTNSGNNFVGNALGVGGNIGGLGGIGGIGGSQSGISGISGLLSGGSIGLGGGISGGIGGIGGGIGGIGGGLGGLGGGIGGIGGGIGGGLGGLGGGLKGVGLNGGIGQ